MNALDLIRGVLDNPVSGAQAQSLLQRVQSALTGKWNFQVDAAKSLIHFLVTANNVTHRVLVVTDERTQIVSLTLKYMRNASPQVRGQMALMLGQLNFRVHMGGYEMDPSDGECQYRHAVDVESLTTPPSFFQRMVAINIRTACDHWPALEKVMNGADWQTALRALS
jgi:VCBS repeat-containing protein